MLCCKASNITCQLSNIYCLNLSYLPAGTTADAQAVKLVRHRANVANIKRRSLLALPLLSMLPGLSMANNKSWHNADGTFSNNYVGSISKSFSELRRAFSGPRPPVISFPLAQNDPAMLGANRQHNTVTWVGHATLLLQLGGLNILTDPHFTQRASPVAFAGPKRTTAPGLSVSNLPALDIVLISHNHYDHLDSASIYKLLSHSPKARYFVPLRLARWFHKAGAENVVEYDWWEGEEYLGAQIEAVPTQHWSNRGLDRNKTLWCSWVVKVPGFAFLFIGDTGYSKDCSDIRQRHGGFDLAAIPIGAYAPRWFMQQAHQNPEEAVQSMLDLNARRAVATHWGTFQLTFEPMDEPTQRLKEALQLHGKGDDDFMVLQHGETRLLKI